MAVAETIRERHYRDRMQSMHRLASLPEHEKAMMSWQDHEDLMALCFELAESGRDLVAQEYRRIFNDSNRTVSWLQERRAVLEELTGAYVQLAESIRNSSYAAWKAAGSPGGEEFVLRLDKAIKAVAEVKRSLLERWPVGSPQEIAEAKAAIARGETLDADESFAEIAGVDVEKWRQSVEEYKGRRQRSTGG
jgi:hypothetical protein